MVPRWSHGNIFVVTVLLLLSMLVLFAIMSFTVVKLELYCRVNFLFVFLSMTGWSVVTCVTVT